MNNDITKTSQADFKVERLHQHEIKCQISESVHTHDLNIPGSPHNHYAPQENYGDKNGDETVVGQIVSIADCNLAPPKVDHLETEIDNLKHIVETTCKPGCYDYDEYMFGMANGLILALATIQNKEPLYLDRPVTLQAELDAPSPNVDDTDDIKPEEDIDIADWDWDYIDMIIVKVLKHETEKEEKEKEEEWTHDNLAAAYIRDEIDNEIIKDLIEIVEEEKVTNFERAMKGV